MELRKKAEVVRLEYEASLKAITLAKMDVAAASANYKSF